MGDFRLRTAIGRRVILEPFEDSNILAADDTATIFKVISVGVLCEDNNLIDGDLVIVSPNSVEKTLMGSKEVCYAREDDVVAVVESLKG